MSKIIAVKHGTYKNYDYMVLNIRGTHFCAYIRLPESHPFYQLPYEAIDLDCHGGLTFSEMTDFENVRLRVWDPWSGLWWIPGRWVEEKVKKGYWIGWDYAHDGDFSPLWPELGGREWTADEVALEAKMVIEELIKKEE